MRQYRKTFECIRCEGLVLKTGEKMISHFRLIHGIKPESFNHKKKKAFYDSFKLADNEYTKDTDEEIEETDSGGRNMDPPSPADNSTHRRYNSITPNSAIQEMETSENQTERSPQAKYEENNDFLTEEDPKLYHCPDCGQGLGYSFHSFRHHIIRNKGGLCKKKFAGNMSYTCNICEIEYCEWSSLRTHNKAHGKSCKSRQISMNRKLQNRNAECTPEPVGCDQILDTVQDVEVTETAATEHTITLYNHIDMIASQGTGPYYCPECRTGLGYSMYSFRSHMGAFRGQCKIINAGKQFHRCQYCKTDFPDPRLLKTHNARFGGSCKAWQLSVNKSEDRYDFNGEMREPIRDESDSPAVVLLTKDELPALYDELKVAQGDGPYFCPHCGKGVGYKFHRLKAHISQNIGSCLKTYANRMFYSCKFCKIDFTSKYTFNRHNKRCIRSCETRYGRYGNS